MAAPMMELLKVGRIEGKKGSVAKVKWTKEGEAGFIALKKALFDSLMVQRLQPDQPFIIHTDASDYAIGAVLSQIDLDRVEHPLTLDDVHHFIDVAMSDPSEKPGHELTDFIQRLPLRPVAFFSRKLTDSQRRTWTPREKEAYAMVSCLKKYASWIAFQPILLLTDHRSLESWATELLDTPSGPAGRKARWHVLLSRFNIHVRYLPGPQNLVADSLSRWAYPASKGLSDCSFHGSKADQMAMSDIISQERDEETHFSAPPASFSTRGEAQPTDLCVVTRSGLKKVRFETTSKSTETPPAVLPARDDIPSPETNISSSTTTGSLTTDPPVRKHVLDENWTSHYVACPVWGPVWHAVKSAIPPWPADIQLHAGKMYKAQKLCVPKALTARFLSDAHKSIGHPGGARFIHEVSLRYHMADMSLVSEVTPGIIRTCEICQATDQPRPSKDGPSVPYPIPPTPMSHVALDLFHMPPVDVDDDTYRQMLVCVCRHSGWVTAIPISDSMGTSAPALARALLPHWEIFGIPSVITSDQGPQWVSAWWRTLCGILGVRQAYSQAYHHRANGRVEVMGMHIRKCITKLSVTNLSLTWVHHLPVAVRFLNDLGHAGKPSAYEIIFGRHRHLADLPYSTPRTAEDAIDFYKRQMASDENLCQLLHSHVHSDKHPVKDALIVGRRVWYLRPKESAQSELKLHTRWIGPCVLVEQVGRDSFRVQVSPDRIVSAHRDQLKPHHVDIFETKPLPLYYFQLNVPLTADEYIVQEILGHRWKNGSLEFKVHWKGYSTRENTWEKPHQFFPEVNDKLTSYCEKVGLTLTLQDICQKA
jgi:hypothetical protein